MSPPGALSLTAQPGGSTSPTQNELVRATRLILDDCGISFSQNRIVRLVRTFQSRAPRADKHTYVLFLANAVQLSSTQRHALLLNPDIARVISYSDPTGETAVNRLARHERRS